MASVETRHASESGARISYSVEELAKLAGLSASFLWREIKDGKLQTLKIGRRRLISAEQAADYIGRHAA